MAQLVHDYVVLNIFWQEDNFVVKVEVSFLRTATPASLLVFDADSIVLTGVLLGKIFCFLLY